MTAEAATDARRRTSSTTSTASCSTRCSGTSRVVAAAVRRARRAARDLRGRGAASAPAGSRTSGVLRQLSAIFDTRALGYSSALVAAKIDPDHIDEAAAIISRHPGVSHNYKRNHVVQPLVHAGRAAGRGLRRAPRRAAPRVRLARHPQAADAEALQDRREARHDRQHRGEREGRGARARAARAPGARWTRPSCRDWDTAVICIAQEDLPLVERPFAAAGRGDRRHRGASCSRRCSRSRTASSCAASPR